MQHLIYAAVFAVAGCGQATHDPSPKQNAPESAPTAAAFDPNVIILKCEGKGPSSAKLAGSDDFSDPGEEEQYVKVNIRLKTLQTWTIHSWDDSCPAGGKCRGKFTNSRLTYRSVSDDTNGDEVLNSLEVWSVPREGGKYSHIEVIKRRDNGKLTVTRKIENYGTCVRVDKPMP